MLNMQIFFPKSKKKKQQLRTMLSSGIFVPFSIFKMAVSGDDPAQWLVQAVLSVSNPISAPIIAFTISSNVIGASAALFFSDHSAQF